MTTLGAGGSGASCHPQLYSRLQASLHETLSQKEWGAKEMALQLKAQAVDLEEPGSILSTQHGPITICNFSPRKPNECPSLASDGTRDMGGTQTYAQANLFGFFVVF